MLKTNMKKISKNQKGFTAVEGLLIILILVVIGAVGYMVYRNDHKTKTASVSSTSLTTSSSKKSSATTKSANPYAGWQTYHSKLGDFTIQYPANWNITGFNGETPVGQNQFNGNETELYISEYPGSTTENNFGVTVAFGSIIPTATPYNLYPNGTTELLPNGLTLWSEKQDINYATGPATDTCPEINIGTDNTFSTKLNNGEELYISGSYCWAQRMTTNYTYQQQVDSSAWNDTVNIIKSATF
jgi:hypothetical protein